MRRRALVRSRRGAATRLPAAVADEWQRWVADNLLRGAEPSDLVSALEQAEVPGLLARRTVASIARSPGLAVARAQRVHRDRREQVLRLRGEVGPSPLTVERTEAPDAETFFARYWQTSTPAVFTDVVTRWRERWTPHSLRERFGEVEIEACTGREGDPRPDAHWQEHREAMTLAEYVERMLAARPGNDLYLIANNRNTARPELRALWDDVVLPAGWFDEPRLPYGSALWLGPAGTTTPLHHDTSNILFCQVHGRKRIVLAPPWVPALLDSADGVYNLREADDLARQDAIALTVEAGEALFIPAGWWHDVRALDASVSLAINAFARPNRYEWYTPGSLRER